MRKLYILLALAALATTAPIIPPQPHYVDSVSGNNANNGLTTATAWATVTYADGLLPTNAPLYLKYPDSTWHRSPAYWHGLTAFFSMVQGSDATKVYDSANGLVCSIVGSATYQSPGMALASSGYINCGSGALGIGAGNQTILAVVYAGTVGAISTIFSNGSLSGSNAGYGLYFDVSPARISYQIRSAGTVKAIDATGYTQSQPHTIVASVSRASSTGMNLYVDGAAWGTPTDPTALSGVNLTNSQNTAIGARFAGGAAGLALAANWINEVRVYNVALSASDVGYAATEASNRLWNRSFGSGTYRSWGMNGSWNGSATVLYQNISALGTGPFWDISFRGTLPTGAPDAHIANMQVLCVGPAAKCNGQLPVYSGELNWLMTYEIPPTLNGTPMFVATSYDGLHWTYVATMPTGGGAALTCYGQGGFYVDGGDATDYHNVHQICFSNSFAAHNILESHPTDATYAQPWSTPVVLLNDSVDDGAFNPVVVKIGSTYTMLWSHWVSGVSHYMHKATCTTGCMAGANWTITQTGNWSGLSNAVEAFTPPIFVSGTTWELNYMDLANGVQRHAISTDDLATFGSITTVGFAAGAQLARGVVKLQ